jgi:hypothetical protein
MGEKEERGFLEYKTHLSALYDCTVAVSVYVRVTNRPITSTIPQIGTPYALKILLRPLRIFVEELLEDN